MGGPKALMLHQGRPWILPLVEALAEVVGSVRVVLGAEAEQVSALLPPSVERVLNLDWAESDMAASLRLGLEGLAPDRLVLICPVDMPPPPPELLRALLAIDGPAVASFQGQDGHPVVVQAAPLAARQTLRDLLVEAVRVPTGWPGAVVNLNTPADLRRWESRED